MKIFTLSFQTRHFADFAPNGGYGWSFAEIEPPIQQEQGRKIVIQDGPNVWIMFGILRFALPQDVELPGTIHEQEINLSDGSWVNAIAFDKSLERLLEDSIYSIPLPYQDLVKRNRSFLEWLRQLRSP